MVGCVCMNAWHCVHQTKRKKKKRYCGDLRNGTVMPQVRLSARRRQQLECAVMMATETYENIFMNTQVGLVLTNPKTVREEGDC